MTTYLLMILWINNWGWAQLPSPVVWGHPCSCRPPEAALELDGPRWPHTSVWFTLVLSWEPPSSSVRPRILQGASLSSWTWWQTVPRTQEQKLQGHLRPTVRRHTLSFWPQSTGRRKSKSSPELRGGETALTSCWEECVHSRQLRMGGLVAADPPATHLVTLGFHV